jgi:hypothetical protein
MFLCLAYSISISAENTYCVKARQKNKIKIICKSYTGILYPVQLFRDSVPLKSPDTIESQTLFLRILFSLYVLRGGAKIVASYSENTPQVCNRGRRIRKHYPSAYGEYAEFTVVCFTFYHKLRMSKNKINIGGEYGNSILPYFLYRPIDIT